MLTSAVWRLLASLGGAMPLSQAARRRAKLDRQFRTDMRYLDAHHVHVYPQLEPGLNRDTVHAIAELVRAAVRSLNRGDRS